MCMVHLVGHLRLTTVRGSYDRHRQELDRVRTELSSIDEELKQLELKAPRAAQRFRFYQELRGYVTDLVECLDEKVGQSFVHRGHARTRTFSKSYYYYSSLPFYIHSLDSYSLLFIYKFHFCFLFNKQIQYESDTRR